MALQLIREGTWAVSLPPISSQIVTLVLCSPLPRRPTVLRPLWPLLGLSEAVAPFVSPLGQGNTEGTKKGEVPALKAPASDCRQTSVKK